LNGWNSTASRAIEVVPAEVNATLMRRVATNGAKTSRNGPEVDTKRLHIHDQSSLRVGSVELLYLRRGRTMPLDPAAQRVNSRRGR
jgi:hypothetical protein